MMLIIGLVALLIVLVYIDSRPRNKMGQVLEIEQEIQKRLKIRQEQDAKETALNERRKHFDERKKKYEQLRKDLQNEATSNSNNPSNPAGSDDTSKG